MLIFFMHRTLVDPLDRRGGGEQVAERTAEVDGPGATRGSGGRDRLQKGVVACPELLSCFELPWLGDDGQFGVHALSADGSLLLQRGPHLLRCALAVTGLVAAQRAFDVSGGVLEITHRHDAHVILVERGVDRIAKLEEQPHGVASHHHQQDDERGYPKEDAVT